jgi:hypothetical protein
VRAPAALWIGVASALLIELAAVLLAVLLVWCLRC